MSRIDKNKSNQTAEPMNEFRARQSACNHENIVRYVKPDGSIVYACENCSIVVVPRNVDFKHVVRTFGMEE